MAVFGGGGNDISVKVLLETGQFDAAADRIRQGLSLIGNQTEKSSAQVQKFERDMEGLARATAKAAKFDRFPDLSKQIGDAFSQQGKLGAEAFADRLFSIGEAANKLGIPLAEVTDRIGAVGSQAGAATGGVSRLTDTLLGVQAAVSVFNTVSGVVRQLGQDLEQAGKNESVSTAFKSLAGAGSVGELGKLRSATQGLVSDVDLMQKANQALLLGLPIKGFDQMAGAAVKLGRAMGIDALQSVESLTLGVGRQSKLILDNLGVIVSVEEAERNFAAAQGIVGRALDDNEKKLAFQAEAYRKIQERAASLSQPLDSAATGFGKVSTALTNANAKFLEAQNRNDALAASLGLLAGQVDQFNSGGIGSLIGYLEAGCGGGGRASPWPWSTPGPG